MSDKALLTDLLHKYVTGTLLQKEAALLSEMLDAPENQAALEQILLDNFQEAGHEQAWSEQYRRDFAARLVNKEGSIQSPPAMQPHASPVRRLGTGFLRYAAAVIILIGGAVWYFSRDTKNTDAGVTAQAEQKSDDVQPGGNKATLTLADGRSIILDSAMNGNLASQGNTEVVKLAEGHVAYRVKNDGGTEAMWNTIATPKGGQYQVDLPDGTRVWLNASSSIKYPIVFAGVTREVQIEGEIYFEVAKDRRKPFIVHIADRSTVQVLGTKFNINAYADEKNIRTTLFEGSVKMSDKSGAAQQTVTLQPGQQATLAISTNAAAGKMTVAGNADMAQALAWKNGLFNFNNLDLSAVMRQLERWYDIKVNYERSSGNIIFKGEMYRNVKLSDVLEVLQKMGVRFRLEGKTLTVI